MTTETIIQLIIMYSLKMGLDPQTALAVAKVESNFKPAAIGSVGEIGLFQIRPEYSRYSKQQLKNPHYNIQEGIRMLKFAKANCIHKKNKTWIVCYNVGVNAGKKIRHPQLFPYYKKIAKAKTVVAKHTGFFLVLEPMEGEPTYALHY